MYNITSGRGQLQRPALGGSKNVIDRQTNKHTKKLNTEATLIAGTLPGGSRPIGERWDGRCSI